MASGYTREMLIDAYVSRYKSVGSTAVIMLKALAETHYDLVGKDAFRVSASLDASAIRLYKALKI